MDTSEQTVVTPPQEGAGTEAPKVEEPQTGEPAATEPKETPEAKVARLDRELKRAKKAAGIEDEPKPKAKAKQSDDLDYGAKSYLLQKGITESDFDFVKEQMEESGITDIDRLVNNPYFKSILKERQDKEAIEKATPMQGRGSSDNVKSKVDYWLNRKELPEDPALRREVVNKRYELSKSVTGFSM